MNKGVSEIDDARFFLSELGKHDASSELEATLDAFFSNEKKDDNSSICRFPARYHWLQEQLGAKDFPKADCQDYKKILKRVDPKSVTMVFPSAHINSPASMFGHTFLRINSSYNSRLLSYAINYAADADMNKENGVTFAIKGLFGGYYGKYSLLPYYDKLKEYRDSEQRDIWEYDFNLTQEETLKLFRHVWELNGTHSYYYFFTENCSYNMLWLIELARPTVHLREHFNYQVIPLETVHASKLENLIESIHYRPSKRTTLLKYEQLIDKKYIRYPVKVSALSLNIDTIVKDTSISQQQKRYILEASIEYMEYQLGKGKLKKEDYLRLFHEATTQRAKLGTGKNVTIQTPADPIDSHRAVRATLGVGSIEGEFATYLGIRPAYHDLEDSNYGFLRGTQIEFMDILLSYSDKKTKVEKATVLSIVSLAPRSEFFKSFSWRMKLGWDRDYLSDKSALYTGVGAGFAWNFAPGYLYFLVDPFLYTQHSVHAGVGGSVGLSIDKYDFMNTNVESSYRFYDTGDEQLLVKVSQGFRVEQNFQVVLNYDFKEKLQQKKKINENTFRLMFKYYF